MSRAKKQTPTESTEKVDEVEKVEQTPTESIEKVDEVEKVYVLADGMSLTTKAGIKVGGNVIKPEYLPDGVFESYKDKDIIIEKK